METERVGTRILVPLDGSELAESALPVAMRLARETKRSLVLARIIPLTTWALSGPNAMVSAETYQEILDKEEQTATAYLDQMAEQPRSQEIPVVTIVQRGEAAAALLEICARTSAGLIVMTTHARAGMARMALGSVADRLVRHGHIPVLLLRPSANEQHVALERAIVPLDSSPLAETALEEASIFAGTVVRELTLVRVVDPDKVEAEDDTSQDEAERYLERAQRQFLLKLARADCAVRTEVLLGEPAHQIVRRAQQDCDLVILATRGQTGARRWVFGSTADRVLHECATPLLLVHPPIEQS